MPFYGAGDKMRSVFVRYFALYLYLGLKTAKAAAQHYAHPGLRIGKLANNTHGVAQWLQDGHVDSLFY
jgi:hypothetical protein